jgi:hypothetical protein
VPDFSRLVSLEPKVKVIEVNELSDIPVKVDGEDLHKILEQGYFVHDERDDDEVSTIRVKATGSKEFINVSQSGIYSVLFNAGDVRDAIVLVDFPVSLPYYSKSNFNLSHGIAFASPYALVILLDGKTEAGYNAFIAPRNKVYASAQLLGEAFNNIYDKLPDATNLLSITRISKDDVFVIISKYFAGDEKLTSTFPFSILDRDKNDFDYHRMLVRPVYDFVHDEIESAIHSEFQLPERLSAGYITSPAFEIIFGRTRKSIVFHHDEHRFYVPHTAKYLKLDLSLSSALRDLYYPGDPVEMEIEFKAKYKPLKMIWKQADMVEMNGQLKDAFTAFKTLIEKYNLREKDAKKALAITKLTKQAEFYIFDPDLRYVNQE